MIDLLQAKESDSMALSFLPSHPLFCTILTLYILFLLYSPPFFLTILLSPVLTLTVVILLTLLRLGSVQERRPDTVEARESCRPEDGPRPAAPARPEEEPPFVGWDVKAPLEVIYEAYEGEDADDLEPVFEPDREPGERVEGRFDRIERWPSLSLCYPESDSDSDSDASSVREFPTIGDWVSREGELGFGWVDAEREGLIEIQLDLHGGGGGGKRERGWDFQAEEENLIEIDISPARNGEFVFEKEAVDSRREEGLVTLR